MFDIHELARAVEAMRRAQRDYFRTRSQSALEDAKRKETRVDNLVKEVLHGKQRGLFDGDNALE